MVCRRNYKSLCKSKRTKYCLWKRRNQAVFTQQVNRNKAPGFLANTGIFWPLTCSLPGVTVEKGPFFQLLRKSRSYQSSAVNTLESAFLERQLQKLSAFLDAHLFLVHICFLQSENTGQTCQISQPINMQVKTLLWS